jgi:Deoxyribonuclease NucA/NucB
MISQLVILTAVASLALAANFDWDCTNSLATCNNACYAVYCKKFTSTLTYDSDQSNRGPRRTASGCNKTPCTNTGYSAFGNSCDEYPFASTTQGGAGAILRCVDASENSSKLCIVVFNDQILTLPTQGEGGQLGNFYKKLNDGDQFDLFIQNYAGA